MEDKEKDNKHLKMDDKEKDNKENEKEKEETKTTNDQEVIKEILDKRSKNPRKSWFGSDNALHKRLSQENIENPITNPPIIEEEVRNVSNEEK